MQLRTYKYRIYPTSKQKVKLFHSFEVSKNTYNDLLSKQKQVYSECKKSLSKFDMNQLIKKTDSVHSQVLQNVSDRLSKSFENFFLRCKDPSCKKKGFPRFKSNVKSITYPQSGYKFLNERRLKVSKIGSIPIVLHRLMRGKIKTLTIKRNNADQWFAYFSCEVNDNIVDDSLPVVGLDVGKQYFTVGSDGFSTEYPFFKEKQRRKLKLLHRQVSRKKKGSKNRQKAIHKLNICYNNITNRREDFSHKLSHHFSKNYSHIAVENLNINNMVANGFKVSNRRTLDVAWRSFFQKLTYKAVISEVKPQYSSQECSNCGKRKKIPLSERHYVCSHCGLHLHRDLNASFNILSRAGLVRTYTPLDIKPLSFSI
jgi:putative transposase